MPFNDVAGLGTMPETHDCCSDEAQDGLLVSIRPSGIFADKSEYCTYVARQTKYYSRHVRQAVSVLRSCPFVPLLTAGKLSDA